MANKPLKSIQFPGLSDTYTVPQVDATLVVSGAAADAKKTGDEISELKQELNQLSAEVEQIETGGLSETAKAALLACFEKVAWIDDDGQDYYDALEAALYPEAVSISAVYDGTGHTVYATDSLTSLKPYLTVTATLNDSSTRTVSDYTLSGTLSVGTSTVTVTYGSLTTTFTVTVSASPVSSITATYEQSGTVYDSDSLNSLKSDLTVVANYSGGGTETLSDNDYTLSGTLTAGTSTVTVSYQGKTTTFTVTVTADPAYITASYTQSYPLCIYDTLDSLKDDLAVTYYANHQATGVALEDTDYTLSGTLAVGTSTITVTYGSLTTTFTVTVTAVTEFSGSYMGTSTYDVTISVSSHNHKYWTDRGTSMKDKTVYVATSGDHNAISAGNASQESLTMYPFKVPSQASRIVAYIPNNSNSIGLRTNVVIWDTTNTNWKSLNADVWNVTITDLSDYDEFGQVDMYVDLSCGDGSKSADKTGWVFGWI